MDASASRSVWWKKKERNKNKGNKNTLYGASLLSAQEHTSSKVKTGLDSFSLFFFASSPGTIIAQTASP